MLTYREAAPAMKSELDQAETASRLGEESRCAMILSPLQIELDHLLLHIHAMVITDDTMDGKQAILQYV